MPVHAEASALRPSPAVNVGIEKGWPRHIQEDADLVRERHPHVLDHVFDWT